MNSYLNSVISILNQSQTIITSTSNHIKSKDHLGNVRETFSDIKVPVSVQPGAGPYSLDLKSINNYYAFGMLMPLKTTPAITGQSWQSEKHRYGFNGKEMDNEVKGNGKTLDFGARIFDSKIGRWFSNDPEKEKLPGWSSYNYCSDNPINRIDVDGRFDATWHCAVFRAVLGKSKIKINEGLIGELSAAAAHTDYFKAFDSRYHFDNLKNLSQIENNFSFTKEGIKNDLNDLTRVYGARAHARADFYSHSNWVELYAYYLYLHNPDSKCNISEIPTWNQMKTDTKFSGFKTFLEDNPNSLYTGSYSSYWFSETDPYNLYAHINMNKDNIYSFEGKSFESIYGTILFNAAEKVAKRDMEELIKEGLDNNEIPKQ